MTSSFENYRNFFLNADADNDGYLSFDEFLNVLRQRGYRGSEKKLRKYFNAADSSGDGQISLDEYMVAMGEQPEKDHKEALMRNCFKGFDKDNNGVIDRSELQAVFREMGRFLSEFETQTMMELVDADGSGTIDFEEFIAHFFGKISAARKAAEEKPEENGTDEDKNKESEKTETVGKSEENDEDKVKDEKEVDTTD